MALEFKTTSGCQEYFSKAHEMVRRSVREFVDKAIRPHIDDWEEEGAFPEELYRQAGEVGILGIGYPEALGGTPGDIFFKIAATSDPPPGSVTPKAAIFSPASTGLTKRSCWSAVPCCTMGGMAISSDPSPATNPPEPQRISSSLAAILKKMSPGVPPNASG